MRLNFISGGVMALAVVSVTAAGCGREAPEPINQAQQTQTATLDDDTLATYVQSRFYAERSVRGSEIDVTAENGVVTLSGTVADDQARQRALDIARQVEGVSSVNDRLKVEPAMGADAAAAANRPVEGGTSRPDDERSPGWITTKIQSQYYLSPEIKPWNIDVTTSQDGVVTLRGEVDEAADRQEAERIAQKTDGVTRVVNRLRLRGETPTAENRAEPRAGDAGRAAVVERPDAWVTAKIQAKYFIDPDVKGLEINVDTNEGVVTLKGEVESEAERRQAVALARNTEGVRTVTDQLRVVPETESKTDALAKSEARRDTTPLSKPEAGAKSQAAGKPAPVSTTIDDTWITTKIQSKYFLDSEVKGRDINVDTRNGIVTLKGTVDSEAEKQAAAAIAQETEGVKKVNNQLAVDTTKKSQ